MDFYRGSTPHHQRCSSIRQEFYYVFGPKIITPGFFDYRWSDQNSATTILEIRQNMLGAGAQLSIFKASSVGGLHHAWDPGGRDVSVTNNALVAPAVVFG